MLRVYKLYERNSLDSMNCRIVRDSTHEEIISGKTKEEALNELEEKEKVTFVSISDTRSLSHVPLSEPRVFLVVCRDKKGKDGEYTE
jgi:hypothetical protein